MKIIAYIVAIALVLVLLKITWNVWEFTQPPYACQQLGGSWSFLNGWSCG